MSGRPCGLLSAFLAYGPDSLTKEEHWSHVEDILYDYDDRCRGRGRVEAAAGGASVLAFERALDEGESAEP